MSTPTPHTPDHAHHAHHSHETAPLHDSVDSWHDHSHDEKPQSAHAEVGNAGKVIGIGLGLFGVIAVAIAATYIFWIWQITARASLLERSYGATSPIKQARSDKSEQLAKVESGGTFIVEATAQAPRREIQILPFARASELVLKEYQAKGFAR